MTLRAVAWDIDGTLVDSEPLHHQALLAGSRLWGVDLSDLPDQAFRGIHMGDVWLALRERLPAHLIEAEWLAAIAAFYIENRTRLSRLPGALETIEILAERGIPQVCVSNSARSIVEANLDALGVTEFMRFTISINDVSAGKPDPEPYRTACERLGLLPSEVLAVEDSLTGAESANRAGLQVAVRVPLTESVSWAVVDAADLTTIVDLFPNTHRSADPQSRS